MGTFKLCTNSFLVVLLCLIMIERKYEVEAVADTTSNIDSNHRIRSKAFLKRPINQYVRLKPDQADFIDEDDFFEMNKRQTSDDYGHLRFGKRGEFDDYGHMRFGRNRGGNDNN